MAMLCKILYPLNLQGKNIQLWEAGVQVFDLDLSENVGGYYVDSALGGTWEYRNLLDAITNAAVSAGAANTYEFQTADSLFGRADFRLKLVATAGSTSFELRTSDASDSILEALGADDAGDLSSSSGAIEFLNTYKGSWLLPKDYQYHDWRKFPQQIAGIATTSANRVFVRTRNKSSFRLMSFLAIPGVLAYESRSLYSVLADDVRGVSFGDTDISFETFWRECISVGREFRFYYGVDPSLVGQPDAGRSELIVTDDTFLTNPSDSITERYKSLGKDYVDIEFRATVLRDYAPSGADVAIPPNNPPVASFTVNTAYLVLTVDGSASSDSDGTITGYAWDYGDGNTATGASPASHTYASAGSYTVSLTCTDNSGSTHTVTQLITAVAQPPASIPEPSTSVTYVSAFRFWEAPVVSGNRVASVPNHYAYEGLSASGVARPTKAATGVGSVVTDGVDQFLSALSVSEYNKIHDGSSDWQMSFTYRDLTEYNSTGSTIFGNGTGDGFRVIAKISSYTRIYAYGASNDNSRLVEGASSGAWRTVTLKYDESTNDLTIFVDGVFYRVDGHFNLGSTTADADSALVFGIHPVATSSKYEIDFRDWRIAWSLGDTTNDGIDYHTWANTNGLLT